MNVIRKKIRGGKRKIDDTIKNIQNIDISGINYDDDYDYVLLPADEQVVNNIKLRDKYRNKILKAFIEKAETIVKKDIDYKFHKIVVMVTYPELFDTNILVFNDETCYKNFFNRNHVYQKWTKLEGVSLNHKLKFMENVNFKEVCFEEVINDENMISKRNLWFYFLN